MEQWIDISGEASRTYHFPNQQRVNIPSPLNVQERGKLHLVRTAERTVVVAPEWLAIEVEWRPAPVVETPVPASVEDIFTPLVDYPDDYPF